MKKTVPDPPFSLGTTAEKPFCTCESSHPPLFNVRAGIAAEEALVHVSLLLRGIQETSDQYCQQAEEEIRGMLWSVIHSAEMARALVDSLVDGMAA